jgi:paraquat-inducible protein B
VPANARFTLFADKSAALRHVSQHPQAYTLYFAEPLRGLVPGASVDFHGIEIGEVRSVGVEYPQRGAQAVRFPVEISIFPERLRARSRSDAPSPSPSPLERDPKDFLERMVARGLRAQLKSANLLTGQLFVALDFFPQAPKAGIDWSRAPAVLPTVTGAQADLQETLNRIAGKLDKVPLEAIGQDLDRTLKTLDATLRSADQAIRQLDGAILPELHDTLGQARQALGNAEQMLSAEAPAQQDLRDTLREVNRAARALRVLADYLSRHPEALIRGKE